MFVKLKFFQYAPIRITEYGVKFHKEHVFAVSLVGRKHENDTNVKTRLIIFCRTIDLASLVEFITFFVKSGLTLKSAFNGLYKKQISLVQNNCLYCSKFKQITETNS